jgi:hypothetical protein
VHPGGIKTAIARNAGAVEGEDAAALAEFFDSKLAKTTPEAAAKTILRAVVGNRPRAVVGLDAKLLDLLVRVTGPRYQRIVAFSASRMKPKAVAAIVPAEPGVLAGEGPSASRNGATKASA